jgi:membrane-bound lytic murein transglycosylase A
MNTARSGRKWCAAASTSPPGLCPGDRQLGAAQPDAGRRLLHHNPSYIFFREVEIDDPELGPLGAMNRSITPMRTIAVDPTYTPLGAPVWIEKEGATPINRLMIAQDTGGAIRGPQRADIFFGFGDDAGTAAGTIRDPGRMIVLLPIERAHQAVPDA